LAIQRELSTDIAQHVGLQLLPERLSALAHRQTKKVEAYDLYLRGRYFWNQLSAVTTKRAMEYYGRATERDPEYALAWSGMADAYSASPINADLSPLQVWPRARDAIAHATASGPSLPEVQTSLGLFKFWLDWDWVAAEAAFRKSIAFDPSYSLAHRFLGIVLSHMARHEEASLAIRQARDLDPFNATNHALSAQVAFAARDYSGAVQFAQQATTIDPEFWIGYIQLAQVYEQLGNTDLALSALNDAGRFSGGNSKAIALRGYICAKVGKTKEAHEVLSTLEAVSRERYVPPYATALVHVGLGQHDSALDWLERAYDAHDVHWVFPPVDPKWDPLRADVHFADLLRRCGFTTPALPAR
jgi:tetratricopeptide (TPR) repeat protein